MFNDYEDYEDYEDFESDGLKFVCTCFACPEQYDVYDIKTKEQVGYVRLRWGRLRVDCPDVGGYTVYEYSFPDGLQGCFDSYEQRTEHLTKIAKVINEYRAKQELQSLD